MSQKLGKILVPKTMSRRNIKNSLRNSHKTLRIIDFLYTTPPIMVTWQTPRADTFENYFKSCPRDLQSMILIALAAFFTNFSTIWGVVSPQDVINRKIKTNLCKLVSFRDFQWFKSTLIILVVSTQEWKWHKAVCQIDNIYFAK